MVLKFILLSVLVQVVLLTAKATPELAGVKIGSVLDLDFVTNLVVDNLPVLALDSFVNLLVVVPVDVLVLSFPYLGYFLEVLEGVANSILVEGRALGQFLKHLVSCWQASIAFNIEAELGSEARWWNNLNTAILVGFLFIVQLFNVVNRTLEFFLGGPEYRHWIYLVQLVVHVFRLDQ